jgi:NADH-quinone oxidoreductase subunit M
VPGFNGFIGEFLILLGSWPAGQGFMALTVLASLGVVLAAAYILWMVQRVLYGEVTNPKNQSLPDLSAREAVVLVPLAVLALFMGVASPLFTRSIEPSMNTLARSVRLAAVPPPALAQAPAPAGEREARGLPPGRER